MPHGGVCSCDLKSLFLLRKKKNEADDNCPGTVMILNQHSARTCRMADQPHEDESQDNVGTGAEISTENDITAKLHDGPDGAPQSAPAVALESPCAAHDRRHSYISY